MFHKEKKVKKSRIVEIDFVRGFLILFMIMDHFFYDFAFLFPQIFPDFNAGIIGSANFYWGWWLRLGFRVFVISLFFLISGISCHFSHNNFKRGLILFIVGALISVGFTVAANYIIHDSSMQMFFGAISCYGTAILLYSLIRFLYFRIVKNHPEDFKWLCLGLGLIIIALGAMFGAMSVKGPSFVVDIKWDNFILVILGIKQHYAADWLPLFPYLGFLFVGAFIGEYFYNERKSYFKPLMENPYKRTDINNENSSVNKVAAVQEPINKRLKLKYNLIIRPYKIFKNTITFAGHYSIFFYILHQPIIILICSIVLLCMGYKLKL